MPKKDLEPSERMDGDPQTGWSIDGGQGREHHAVFNLSAPLGEVKSLQLTLLFERYYAAGLGRFRIGVTRGDAVAAHDLPAEVEAALLVPEEKRLPEQQAILRGQYLRTCGELADGAEAHRGSATAATHFAYHAGAAGTSADESPADASLPSWGVLAAARNGGAGGASSIAPPAPGSAA